MSWIEVGKLPKVPRWLLEFAPHLREGEVIRPSRIKTPSGQLWNKTPESQRQMLKEYADWTLANAVDWALTNKVSVPTGLRTLEDIEGDMMLRRPADAPNSQG